MADLKSNLDRLLGMQPIMQPTVQPKEEKSVAPPQPDNSPAEPRKPTKPWRFRGGKAERAKDPEWLKAQLLGLANQAVRLKWDPDAQMPADLKQRQALAERNPELQAPVTPPPQVAAAPRHGEHRREPEIAVPASCRECGGTLDGMLYTVLGRPAVKCGACGTWDLVRKDAT